jgi:hypothetical protein
MGTTPDGGGAGERTAALRRPEGIVDVLSLPGEGHGGWARGLCYVVGYPIQRSRVTRRLECGELNLSVRVVLQVRSHGEALGRECRIADSVSNIQPESG